MKRHVILLSLFIKYSVFAMSTFHCEQEHAPHYKITTIPQGIMKIRLGEENSPQNICILSTMKKIQSALCCIHALTDHLDKGQHLSLEFQYVGNETFKTHINKHFKSLGLQKPIIGYCDGSSCLNLSYQGQPFSDFIRMFSPKLTSDNFQKLYSIVEKKCISAFPEDMNQLGDFFCLLNRVMLSPTTKGIYAKVEADYSPNKIAVLVWYPVDKNVGIKFVIKFDILKGSFGDQSYTIKNTGTLLTIYPTTLKLFQGGANLHRINQYYSPAMIYLEELKKFKLAFFPDKSQEKYIELFGALLEEVGSSIMTVPLERIDRFLLDEYLDVYLLLNILQPHIQEQLNGCFQDMFGKVNALLEKPGITHDQIANVCYFMECLVPTYKSFLTNYDDCILIFPKICEIFKGRNEEEKSALMHKKLRQLEDLITRDETLLKLRPKVLATGRALPESVSRRVSTMCSPQSLEIRKELSKGISDFYRKSLKSILDGISEGWDLCLLNFSINQLSASEQQYLTQSKDQILATMLRELQKEKKFKNLKTIDDYFMILMKPNELLWRAGFFARLYFNVLTLDDSGLVGYIEKCVKKFIGFTQYRQKHYPKYIQKTTELLRAGKLIIFSYDE